MGCCISQLNSKIALRFPSSSSIAHKEVCSVNLQYRQSLGHFQVKGNGALVLTDEVLWFTPVARCAGCCCHLEDIEVLVSDIKEAKITNGTPQRMYGRPCFLCVDAGSDVLYFYSSNPEAWKAAIDKTLARLPLPTYTKW